MFVYNCCPSLIFKSLLGVGLGVGALLSLVIFRRRLWPIHYGVGIGFGYALKDFELQLNNVPGSRHCPMKKA